ncbi:hypothetical protein JQX13_32300 [Archangium violaceum]|uniref:DUF7738 domain-containing protein n=1 Tax=Archangium violaceum TaxID=83451 RepID=UPI00193C4D88|nr:hypothetical protein [Archangium violaceum]QRK04885.1 hypothetical protein JQX13_32300 [Archangium violaceum]
MRTLLLLLMAGILGCSRGGSRAEDAGTAPSGPTLTIEGATLSYNGQPLPLPGSLETWKAVLGEPSRMVERAKNTYVWDDLGLYAGTLPGRQLILNLVVILNPREPGAKVFKHLPRTTFQGRLLVDGAWVHGGSTIEEINRDKRGTSFSRGYLPRIYHYFFDTRPNPEQYSDRYYYIRIDFNSARRPEDFSIAYVLYDPPPDGGTPDGG